MKLRQSSCFSKKTQMLLNIFKKKIEETSGKWLEEYCM